MRRIAALALSGTALLLMTGMQTAQSQRAGLPLKNDTVKVSSNEMVALAPMSLSGMTNPPDKIGTAMVLDATGSPVGAVRKVEMDANGKPLKVDVALLGSGQVVALDSSSLSYDEANNILTAGLDKSQIVRMPVAPQG